MKIFVSVTEFCRRNKLHKFCLISLIFCNKLGQQNSVAETKDFHKNSPVHTEQFVAATCHCDMLLQLVA